MSKFRCILCDLRVLFSVEEWEGLDASVGHDNDWKSVQVNCEKEMILRYWGVYVYREETTMADIQFTSPYPESSGSVLGKRWLEVEDRILSDEIEEEKRSETASSYGEEEDWTAIGMEIGTGGYWDGSLETVAEWWKRLKRSCSDYCDEEEWLAEVKYDLVKDADNTTLDVEKQVLPPSFSESLQTVVGNLNMALRERKGSGLDLEDEEDQDHEDYSTLEWLAETILSDEEEGESESQRGKHRRIC